MGDRIIENTPKLVAGKLVVNNDLSKFTNVLSEHARSKKLKKTQLLKWLHWIFVDAVTMFKNSPKDTKRPTKALDSQETVNRGLVNKERLKLRCQTIILSRFIRGFFILEQFKPFCLSSQAYNLHLEEDKKIVVSCGVALLALIMESLDLDTRITTNHLKKKLQSLTFAEYGNSITSLVYAINMMRKSTLSLNLIRLCNDHSRPKFQFGFLSTKGNWKDKKKTINIAIAVLCRLEKDIKAQGKWGALYPTKEQIIILKSRAQKRKKAKKISLSSKTRGGRQRQKEHQDTSTRTQACKIIIWNKMVWCPHPKSKDGNVNEMYVTHPHDHKNSLPTRMLGKRGPRRGIQLMRQNPRRGRMETWATKRRPREKS